MQGQRQNISSVLMASAAVFTLGLFRPCNDSVCIDAGWSMVLVSLAAVLFIGLVMQSNRTEQSENAIIIKTIIAVILGFVYGALVSAVLTFSGFKLGKESLWPTAVIAALTYLTCFTVAGRVFPPTDLE